MKCPRLMCIAVLLFIQTYHNTFSIVTSKRRRRRVWLNNKRRHCRARPPAALADPSALDVSLALLASGVDGGVAQSCCSALLFFVLE